ncbi:MAG: transcriptional repressor [Acidimicrobiia bacterium]
MSIRWAPDEDGRRAHRALPGRGPAGHPAAPGHLPAAARCHHAPHRRHAYESARAEMPTISRRTVYQTVHDLESPGEVELLDIGTGSPRADPNVDHAHQHLVCIALRRGARRARRRH